MLTIIYPFVILISVAARKKPFSEKRDMRKCRNWQTSKTKDLVSIALVWVQVPSSALEISNEMRYAEVSELADEQD